MLHKNTNNAYSTSSVEYRDSHSISVEPSLALCLNIRGIHQPVRNTSVGISILVILLGGDIHSNPGPIEYPCGVCGHEVKDNDSAIDCDSCNTWLHISCIGIPEEDYKVLHNKSFTWICTNCSLPQFSDSFIEDIQNDHNPFEPLADRHENTDALPHPSNIRQPRQPARPRRKFNRKLNVLNINVQGIKGKEKQKLLELIAKEHNPDIIFGTESHLDPSYGDSEVFPDGYLVKRNDRDRHGGGVFVAYKQDYIVTQPPGYGTGCELVVTKFETANNPAVYLAAYYRPTDCDLGKLKALSDDLEKLRGDGSRCPNLILAGDFNVPDVNWEDHTIASKPQYGTAINEAMLDIAQEFTLEQKVQVPTHGENTLDLIFTTCPDLVSDIRTIPGMCKHEGVLANVDLKAKINHQVKRKIHVYSQANWENIRNDISHFRDSFLQEADNRDTQTNWDIFKSEMGRILRDNVPTKTLKARPGLPYMTTKIMKMMKGRRRIYDKAKRTSKVSDWNKYHNLQKLIKKELKVAHNAYLVKLFDENPGERNKALWSYIKGLKKDKVGISSLNFNGKQVDLPKDKAEALSEQYKSVFTDEDLTNIPDKGHSPYATMPDITVTAKGVYELLKKLNPKKAVGPDNISTRILKENAEELAPVLQHIFQQSLDSGIVPKDWQNANVTAIFKNKGQRTEPVNYRPVSLTCITCKVLEHIIFSSVMKHSDALNILKHFQHGFRKYHSCETQLLTTCEDLLRSLDRKCQIDCLILDFSKAFDTVAHRRLLYKLDYYGIRGTTKKWIEGWLTSRTQTVVVDGAESAEAKVTSGVPQGTVLGPLLFLLYINDIGENVTSTIKLFADDCLLYRVIKDRSDAQNLQSDLETVTNWSRKWQMSFNPSKCTALRIHRKKTPVYHSYEMMGTTLQDVDQATYLGLELTKDMSWGPQVEKTAAKATRALNFVKRNLSGAPKTVRSTAYQSLVRPILEYGHTVWDPYQKNHIATLEQVQRRAARFVTGDYSTYSSVTSMLDTLDWLSLQERRCAARLGMLHKARAGETAVKLPPYVQVPSSQSLRGHQTWSYSPIRASTDYYLYSFFPRTIRCWNILPASLITIKDSTQFMQEIRSGFADGSLIITDPRNQYTRPRLGSSSVPTGPIVLF